MVRSVSADELLRDAREAARTRNVREAVRELALHALRSRLLTASHIAVVARAVGRGIESSEVPPTAPVRETNCGAWAGLEDAVGEALHAVEIAARQFADGRARLTPEERERVLAEIEQLERTLREGWQYPRAVSAPLQARIASVIALLRRPAIDPPVAPVSAVAGPDSGGMLSVVASGVLLGLSEVRGGTSDRTPG
jgi:hypothetical protein